ncbi:MAG: hypothetical protein J7493_15375 [Porphyrobacter sp.]|nr:hypothetical protein [Porphyrobacter sp.]
MDFSNRLKKEMSEGIVRAVLEDAGYRVTDFGIEKLVPGLNRHTRKQYEALAFPTTIRKLPDFIVTAGDEQSKQLVEVKYRTAWQLEVLSDLREQVEAMREIVLVSFNASAPNPRGFIDSPARFLRCCRLRCEDGRYEAELRGRDAPGRAWYSVDSLGSDDALWWQMSPLREVFPQLREQERQLSLRSAVKAISGILHEVNEDPAGTAQSSVSETSAASPAAHRRGWRARFGGPRRCNQRKGNKS